MGWFGSVWLSLTTAQGEYRERAAEPNDDRARHEYDESDQAVPTKDGAGPYK